MLEDLFHLGGSMSTHQQLNQMTEELKAVNHALGRIETKVWQNADLETIKTQLSELKDKVADDKLAAPIATLTEKVICLEKSFAKDIKWIIWLAPIIIVAIISAGGWSVNMLLTRSDNNRTELHGEIVKLRDDLKKDSDNLRNDMRTDAKAMTVRLDQILAAQK
ncbi:MAG: hypothetical protein ACHP7O_06895 [Burkholderiales bacterium]